MANINKNIIMQAGAAVANATNKAAGLSAATPEPGSIISAIQIVNGGRELGPASLLHFTESVRNKLLSLLVTIEPIQSGAGDPSPDNVRPISGRKGLTIYVSPTPNVADATTYAVDWTSEAGTVYGGTLDVVSGLLTVDRAMVDLGERNYTKGSRNTDNTGYVFHFRDTSFKNRGELISSQFKEVFNIPNWESLPVNCCNSANGSYIVFCADYPDAATFKTAMSGVQLCYELATPIMYQLTGTDIVTLVGDNYIWSDSGDVTITE